MVHFVDTQFNPPPEHRPNGATSSNAGSQRVFEGNFEQGTEFGSFLRFERGSPIADRQETNRLNANEKKPWAEDGVGILPFASIPLADIEGVSTELRVNGAESKHSAVVDDGRAKGEDFSLFSTDGLTSEEGVVTESNEDRNKSLSKNENPTDSGDYVDSLSRGEIGRGRFALPTILRAELNTEIGLSSTSGRFLGAAAVDGSSTLTKPASSGAIKIHEWDVSDQGAYELRQPTVESSVRRANGEIANANSGAPTIGSLLRDQILTAVTRLEDDGRVEIALDPPELGRVILEFEPSKSGALRAIITADVLETVHLLRENITLLQDALNDRGLHALSLELRDRHAGSEERHNFHDALTSLDESANNDGKTANAVQMYVSDGRLDRVL